jgi:hypothetical protein
MVWLLCVGVGQAQWKTRDYNKLTPDEIEQIKAEHLQFYKYEGERRELSVKRALLNEGLLFNRNQSDYDVKHYGIHVSINFTGQSIIASIDYRLKSMINGLQTVDLNLHNQLHVDSVKVGGVGAAFSHINHLISITTPTSYNLNAEFSMTVYYHGQPVSGYGYTDGGMGFANMNGYDICWTATEPFASRNWWPCKDTPEDKADSLDLYVEYPSAYKVASNGVVVSDVDLGGGRKLVHWKHRYPITTYLVALTCANFVMETKTWNYGGRSMPVYSYYLPTAYDSRNVFDTLTIPVLDIFSDAFGIYPFVNEKLANANCGYWGTMEHQTCSFHEAYTPYYDPVYLLVHENAHQWWGDMITCKTFNHIWINEGFGTYSEAIFYEHQFGTAAYFNHLQTQKYMDDGTIYVEDPLTENIFDGNLTYNKGAWVVHMLRGVLGDSTFFKALHDWAFSSFRYGSATTEDLSSVISSSVGSDMYWFFHQWIYGDGHPEYEISWRCQPDTAAGNYKLIYFISQVQTGGTYFKMPIRTRFITTGGNVDTTILNDGSGQLYTLHFADSVTNIIVDPQEWILRSVTTIPFTMHIVTTTLPAGNVGTPYYQKLEAAGGVEPYRWTRLGGDMPLGLSFFGDTIGVISGVPSWAATYYFTLQVTDSDSPPRTDARAYALTIEPAQLCGDADGNGMANISDAVYLIRYIFEGGPAPVVFRGGDADCNGLINISDPVYLVNYVFGGGMAPCAACP